jgi:ATP-dependent helicase HrpA
MSRRDHHIKVMTDGVLLQEIHRDRYLTRYSVLIIDEAHERSVNIDLLLGYLKGLLKKRPDLRLIIVSATLHQKIFQDFFPGCFTLNIPSEHHPIKDFYLPPHLETQEKKIKAQWAVDQALSHQGDILFFLPTEGEIERHARFLQERYPQLEVLKLFARASYLQQQKIFSPATKRRLILSTNIAETSLTIPGIDIVIDQGEHKISCYDPGRKITTYPIVPITQANQQQRRGRAGRLRPGFYFALYTQEAAVLLEKSLDPMIVRTSLPWVILKILSLGIKDLDSFPFLSSPSPLLFKEGWQYLEMTHLVELAEGGLPRVFSSLEEDKELNTQD